MNENKTRLLFQNVEFDGILSCVHCGLCLDSCPTYRELGTEQDSPRGRLYLMRGLWEGQLELTQEVIDPLNRCLDCRACQTACPSNVSYGELLEKTRGMIQENQPQSFKERFLRGVLLKWILTSTTLLRWSSWLMKQYVDWKIPKLLTSPPLKTLLPPFIVKSQHLLPEFSGQSVKLEYASKGALLPNPQQTNHYKVGFFTGCIMDVAESKTHEASLQLLQAAGCEVIVPKEQGCCGALHVHSGDRKTASMQAIRNLGAFENHQLDAIITNAAGCGAQLKEYHHLFHKEAPLRQSWLTFESKVVDILEFLARIPDWTTTLSWKIEAITVFYDAPCHLQHAQGVNKNPQALLNRLPGVTLIPLAESDWCCGSAGIYNLVQPKLAGQVLDRKLATIHQAREQHPAATTIVTGNPGCLFQIRSGIRAHQLPLRVIHPIVFMAERLLSS